MKEELKIFPDGVEIASNAKLVFNDDFSGDKLNEEVYDYCLFSKPQTTEEKSYELVRENVAVQDGKLVLTATEGTKTHYQGAEIRTKEKYHYGYYEIKAKMDPSTGVLPAFWLVDNGVVNNWHYEIDIFECFATIPGTVKGTLLAHYYPDASRIGTPHPVVWEFDYERGNMPLVTHQGEQMNKTWYEYGDVNEWHTYGLDWQKDSVTWYVDGQKMLRADIPQFNVKYGDDGEKFDCYFDNPLVVVLTCYSGNGVYGKVGDFPEDMDWSKGTSLEVEYLRIWQYE